MKESESFSSIMKAETYLALTWYKQNKIMLFFQVLWPYLTIIMLIAIGSAYGSLKNFAKALGIKDPLLYILFSSFVVFTSAGIIDTASQIILWHRWLGTLQYIALASTSLRKYVLISALAQTLVMTGINLLALLPGAIALVGLRAFIDISIVEAFIVLGSVPLLGIAALAALLSVMVKEENNIFSFMNPFILLLSGVFYPVEVLPKVLSALSRYIPVTYTVESAKLIAASTSSLGKTLLLLASVLALFSAIYNFVSYPAVVLGEKALKKGAKI